MDRLNNYNSRDFSDVSSENTNRGRDREANLPALLHFATVGVDHVTSVPSPRRWRSLVPGYQR